MSSKVRAPEPPPCLMTSLPEDIIVARVPRYYYPTISLVSKGFRSLVASAELYTRRFLLSCTEQCLYVVISNCWYILCRKADSKNRLVALWSLPRAILGGYVAVGSNIYVSGGANEYFIDCRSHRVQTIEKNPHPVAGKVIGTIDGKVYVIGERMRGGKGSGVVVFDTVTQKWEPEMRQAAMKLGHIWHGGVVMEDKIYMQDFKNSFSYGPKEDKWELEKMLNTKSWEGACVVDNVLYYYDFFCKKLRAYDPKQRRWGVVNGLEELLLEISGSWESNTVGYGGKLALFFTKHRLEPVKETKEFWCAEIALERRQGGEIWGKGQWCNNVLIGHRSFKVMKVLAVTV